MESYLKGRDANDKVRRHRAFGTISFTESVIVKNRSEASFR
jgi:hypothetical protein